MELLNLGCCCSPVAVVPQVQDVAAIAKGFKDPLGLMFVFLGKSMKKFFCEFLEHL